MKRLTICLILFVTGSAKAAGFGFQVSDQFISLSYLAAQSTNFSGPTVDFGISYNEHEDLMGHFKITVEGEVVGETESFNVGVGTKIGGIVLDEYDQSPEFTTTSYAALVLKFAYVLTTETPMEFFVETNYAPKVLSFQDLNRYVETEVGYTVQFLPSAFFAIGYRNILLDPIEGSEIRIIEGSYISFGAVF